MIWWFIALQSSVDRLVSSAMLGVTLTGYYALGLSFVSILVLLPQVVAKVLYPKVNESIGRGRQNIENLVVAPARIVSLTVPFFLGCLALMLPLIYKRFFPAYLHGLRSCEILLLAAFFLSQLRSGINLLIARSRQNLILIYILSTLAINFLLDVGFVSLGLSIEGLSMGTVISATILCTLIWRAVLSDLGRNRREIISEILHLYFPCILSILIVASIQIVRQAIYHTVNDMYSTVFGETVIFVTSVSLVMLFFGTYRSWMAQYFSLGKVAIRLRKNVTFNEE
jgi:O-antigen/teichoic acid export membrane protein